MKEYVCRKCGGFGNPLEAAAHACTQAKSHELTRLWGEFFLACSAAADSIANFESGLTGERTFEREQLDAFQDIRDKFTNVKSWIESL